MGFQRFWSVSLMSLLIRVEPNEFYKQVIKPIVNVCLNEH
jgi:hypothetical protein